MPCHASSTSTRISASWPMSATSFLLVRSEKNHSVCTDKTNRGNGCNNQLVQLVKNHGRATPTFVFRNRIGARVVARRSSPVPSSSRCGVRVQGSSSRGRRNKRRRFSLSFPDAEAGPYHLGVARTTMGGELVMVVLVAKLSTSSSSETCSRKTSTDPRRHSSRTRAPA